MGGADAVVGRARESYAAGDLRWVAEVLNHVVFAEPGHEGARALLADTYEQLGYGAENGTWRCAYLSGAAELRSGGFGTPVGTASEDVLAQLTPGQLFDALAVRVDGPRCWDEHLSLDVDLHDVGERYRLVLRNGVLTHTAAPQATAADLVLRLPRAALPGVLAACSRRSRRRTRTSRSSPPDRREAHLGAAAYSRRKSASVRAMLAISRGSTLSFGAWMSASGSSTPIRTISASG
jgi:alkyl sulfatase BDS1-like metallo-beta-lactamase superfamily hydrolase